MNNTTQLNMTLPEELPQQLFFNISNSQYGDVVRRLDKHALLDHYDIESLSTILGTIDKIKKSNDVAVHLIEHEPMTGYRFRGRPFMIGDMMALQNEIKYTALQVHNPCRFSTTKTTYLNRDTKFMEELQQKGITPQEMENALNAKTLYLYSRDNSTIPKAQEYVNNILSEGILPVHFSVYRLPETISPSTLSLQGLHVHLYSNHVIEEMFKDTVNYNAAREILNLPLADKQRKMLEQQLGKLPQTDLKFLRNPGEAYDTILAYIIK